MALAALAALGAAMAVACGLPNPAMLLAGVAVICVAVPLLSLAIGWPILLIFLGKSALGAVRHGRQYALGDPRARPTR
jgi:hypothetical protein